LGTLLQRGDTPSTSIALLVSAVGGSDSRVSRKVLDSGGLVVAGTSAIGGGSAIANAVEIPSDGRELRLCACQPPLKELVAIVQRGCLLLIAEVLVLKLPVLLGHSLALRSQSPCLVLLMVQAVSECCLLAG